MSRSGKRCYGFDLDRVLDGTKEQATEGAFARAVSISLADIEDGLRLHVERISELRIENCVHVIEHASVANGRSYRLMPHIPFHQVKESVHGARR